MEDVQREIAYKIIVGCDFQHELEVNLAATTANKIIFMYILINT